MTEEEKLSKEADELEDTNEEDEAPTGDVPAEGEEVPEDGDVPAEGEEDIPEEVPEISDEEKVENEIRFTKTYKQLIDVKKLLLDIPKRIFIDDKKLFEEYEELLIEIKSLLNSITVKNSEIIIDKFNKDTVKKLNTFIKTLKVPKK